MAENFSRNKSYAAFVVDMDGTLYYKRRMQLQVLFRLICYYFIRIHRLKELFILRTYRKLRDKEEFANAPDFEQQIIRRLSQIYRCPEKLVQQTINEWILTKPIALLYAARDRQLIGFIQKKLSENKKVFIYSDYPAKQKCEALQIQASDIYWPDQTRISVLKPSSKGLAYILQENQLAPQEVLFIGDRMEKDGKCAQGAGVDFLILKKSPFSRWLQYKRLSKMKELSHEEPVKL